MIRAVFLASLVAFPAPPQVNPEDIARPSVVPVTVTWHGWVRDKQTGEVFGGAKGYEATTRCAGAVINPAGYVVTTSSCVHSGPEGGTAALVERAMADLAKMGRIGDPAKARRMLTERAVAEGAAPDRPIDRVITVGDDTASVVDLVAPADGDIAVLRIPRSGLPSVEIRDDRPPAVITSGGVVIDEEGRLVGLVGRDGAIAEARLARGLLRDVKPELGAHDRNYRVGLSRYHAGNYDSAIDYFDAVVAESPANTHAAEFRAKAAAKGGSPGDATSLQTLLIYVFGGVTLIAGGLGVWLLRRRAGSAPPVPPQPDPSP
ncbi:hypothetical protein KIPE111705_12945 [Kibdelosporangium persicum]|uniref:Tetratricopeptide repeat protein n=1 Tax=Kibdelosporangium persicum TaxID=2698649 RepID=A0ABX2F6Y3_9PSEU|nr:hypothetical protein [Kibdelosporangium persicum]NRN67118.1 hypothetical protein [Kibdelosporangium persicum]